MARFGKVKRVTTLQMELELQDADALLLFLDKARTQMMNDGSNTADNMATLNNMEQALNGVIRGD